LPASAKIIGNPPNLMGKSIVESYGVKIPNFFAYTAWSHMPAAAAVGGHGGVLPLADRQMAITKGGRRRLRNWNRPKSRANMAASIRTDRSVESASLFWGSESFGFEFPAACEPLD
jgi:hypothetical protein